MNERITEYLMPVGISDFRMLQTTSPKGKRYLSIDKSEFISEIMEDGSQVILITRPRRFGKTLALSMLRYFLAEKVGGKETAELFTNLAIAKDTKVMAHQGKYPVIFISFKEIKDNNFKAAKTRIADDIRLLYEEFSYLAPSLSKSEAKIYQSILDRESNDEDLQRSLANLSMYLTRFHGVEPYLLIDEYDTPIQTAYKNDYYQDMTSFVLAMFGSCLKDNISITKAILTGITRVAKESLFSGVNNFELYTLFDDKYRQYFGFIEDEVNDLFARSGIKLKSEEIKDWYNGYQCGGLLIYNPWSIIKCLNKKGAIASYWVNSSDNKLATDLILREGYEIKEKFQLLLEQGEITEIIDDNLVYGSLKENRASVWSLLLMSGYLKATKIVTDSFGSKICTLSLPNKEVLYFYCQAIQEWLSNDKGISWYRNCLQDLLDAKLESFEENLQTILLETFAFADVNRKNQENFYHGFVLGLIVSLRETHEIKSNRESGLGFYDVLIIPKNKLQRAIILEFKAVENKKNLEKTAQKALEQIRNRKYHIELKQRDITNILSIGIAFSSKHLKMYHNIN